MSDILKLEGLTVAPNVINTIVALATEKVEGVAAIQQSSSLRKSVNSRNIEISTNDAGELEIGIHVQAYYGTKLNELGAAIQGAVCDALAVQVGVKADKIDVYIDSLVFAE
ncbi:MAG: Asp23/Gls24 family envelope stress response protein [Coriobacteriia bacterium]|nr:Asp23/Gls24 family envelope stress response protein [Coriobacteriia bacterium]